MLKKLSVEAIQTINRDALNSDKAVGAWSVRQTLLCGEKQPPSVTQQLDRLLNDCQQGCYEHTLVLSCTSKINTVSLSASHVSCGRCLSFHLTALAQACTDTWLPCRTLSVSTDSRRSPTAPSVWVHLCRFPCLFHFLFYASVFYWSKPCPVHFLKFPPVLSFLFCSQTIRPQTCRILLHFKSIKLWPMKTLGLDFSWSHKKIEVADLNLALAFLFISSEF